MLNCYARYRLQRKRIYRIQHNKIFQIQLKSSQLEIIECSSHLRALSLIENRALITTETKISFLLSLEKLQRLQWQLALQQIQIEQPLLIPIVFRLTEAQFQAWQQYSDNFKKNWL